MPDAEMVFLTPSDTQASASSAGEDEREASLYSENVDDRSQTDASGSTTKPNNTVSQEALAIYHSAWRSNVSACMIDPFGSLPIEVDEVTNQLLYFYAQSSYWQTAYALSPKVKASIKGSWEYHAGISTTHFHVLMARSALHQLRMNRWAATTTRKHLQFAAAKHQAEAVTILRQNVAKGSEANLKEILTSVISLATFENRYGSRKEALVHFKAAQNLFRRIGIGSGLEDRLREEQALWFEGIYADPGASFMWREDDVGERLQWFIILLDDVDRIWRDKTHQLHSSYGSFIPADSRLNEFVSRDTTGRVIGAYGDINEAAIQQRCLFIIVTIIVTLYFQIVGRKTTPTTPARFLLMFTAVQAYLASMEDLLIENNLGEEQAIADLLWIMLQNFRDLKFRTSDVSAAKIFQNVDLQRCHWHACAVANVAKYMPEHRRWDLRFWLLGFVTGKKYTGKLKLDESGFSYADFGDNLSKI